MARRTLDRPIPGEPIGATAQWRAAVRAARCTCQCKVPEGRSVAPCGRKHAATGGECDKRLTATSGVRLYAIPAGGGGALMVVCEDCYDGRGALERREAARAAQDRAELFALPGLGLDDVAGA